jgi:hypothetical protein
MTLLRFKKKHNNKIKTKTLWYKMSRKTLKLKLTQI